MVKHCKRMWLEYCESSGCVYCDICVLFSKLTALGTTFSAGEFNEWKNAFLKLKEHENSMNNLATLSERGQLIGYIYKKLAEQIIFFSVL